MAKAQARLNDPDRPISWIIHDLNEEAEELPVEDSSVDAVLSTLVIEHLFSLDRFFRTIFRILKKTKDSWAWITAMHPNMYRAGSQAGFSLDQSTGEKFCGTSYDHSIDEIIQAARRNQLIVVDYREKGVENEEQAQRLGSRARNGSE